MNLKFEYRRALIGQSSIFEGNFKGFLACESRVVARGWFGRDHKTIIACPGVSEEFMDCFLVLCPYHRTIENDSNACMAW